MKRIFALICIACVMLGVMVAHADNMVGFISGKQDHMILGSVKDISEKKIVITVDHVLSEPASKLIGTDITVSAFEYSYCEEHTPDEFNSPIISDNLVISVDKKGDAYVVKNGAYKVDSNEYASCKIVVHEDMHEEDCLSDLMRITCFIRSNAKVKEFEFDEEGRIYAAYPQTVEQCVNFVDDDGTALVDEETPDTLPTVPPAAPGEQSHSEDNRWIIAVCMLVVGSIAGMGVLYLVMTRKNS
ncbi:MAG: hypothetical protein J6D26_06750 [Clostridia bacterium]|nr:hypothetical protein [Clostridia bacterium]